MKHHPIYFKESEIPWLLDGGKKQFRLVKEYDDQTLPYGVGDLLWVRESFGLSRVNKIVYKSSASTYEQRTTTWFGPSRMMKTFSRIRLIVREIVEEPLNNISDEDLMSELGMAHTRQLTDRSVLVQKFRDNWNRRNFARNRWGLNPMVFVVRYSIFIDSNKNKKRKNFQKH